MALYYCATQKKPVVSIVLSFFHTTRTTPQTATTAALRNWDLAHQPQRHDLDVVGRVVDKAHGLVGAGLGLHALHDVDGLSLQLAEAAVCLAVGTLRACSGTQCVCSG
jgi:hypothetical protein